MNPKTSTLVVDLPVTRSGTHGAIGLLDIYHKPNGGKEEKIGTLGNATIFSEITRRKFSIVTRQKNLRPGQLRVVYSKAEGKMSDYKVMDEKTFPVGGASRN